jgi:hypothetical protein
VADQNKRHLDSVRWHIVGSSPWPNLEMPWQKYRSLESERCCVYSQAECIALLHLSQAIHLNTHTTSPTTPPPSPLRTLRIPPTVLPNT